MFQIINFPTVDCDVLLNYEKCAAVVAKSSADRRVIVAFRGSTGAKQIIEQLVGSVIRKTLSPVGGKVSSLLYKAM